MEKTAKHCQGPECGEETQPVDEAVVTTDKRVVQPEKTSLTKRMNRISGQVNGISKMIEEDRYCVDILTQISAVKSALNGVAMQLLEDHTKHCVRGAIQNGGGDEAIKELTEIIRKFSG